MLGTITPVIQLQSPRLQRLYRDWNDRRQGREFPARADFTPYDLKYILGNLSLIDVGYDPLRFRYRLHATKLADRMGHEMTDKSVDDIPDPGHAAQARAHFTEVVERRVPTAYIRDPSLITQNEPYSHVTYNSEVLVLPLSTDGITIDMLMSALVWDTE